MPLSNRLIAHFLLLLSSCSSCFVVRQANADILYGIDVDTDQLVIIDPTTATATAVGSLGTGFDRVDGLAYDSSRDILFGVDFLSDQLLTIDRQTGTASVIGPIGNGFGTGQIQGLTYDPVADQLLGSNTFTPNQLVSINRDTGLADGIALLGGPVLGLAFGNDTLFGVRNFAPGGPILVEIDRTGSFTNIGDASVVTSLAFDPETNNLLTIVSDPFTFETTDLATIDTATGEVRIVGSTGFTGVASLAFAPQPVPEPNVATAFLALFMLQSTRRRRT